MASVDLLMIEDDADIPALLESLAIDHPVTVAHTDLGTHGVALARQGAALTILDLELPDLHGHDVIEDLSACNPVVVFTGSGARDHDSTRQGAIAHLRKPTDAHSMERLLNAMLDCTRMLLDAGLGDDVLERVARAGLIGQLPGWLDDLDAAAGVLNDASPAAIAEAATRVEWPLQQLGAPVLLDALSTGRAATGQEATLWAACIAVALQRCAQELRAMRVPVTH